MVKSRLIEKFQEKTGITEVITKDPDLSWAKDNYNTLIENLHALVDCLKEQHQSLKSVRSSRLDVVKAIQGIAEETPMWEPVGAVMMNEDGENVNTGSYASIMFDIDKKSEMLIERFEEYVVQYAEEWKKIVKTRVTQSLRSLERSRIEYDHYQRKVTTMRNSIEAMNDKGKDPNSGFTEKLTRNVEKLDEWRKCYEKTRIDTYMLLNEVTLRSWKDLQPLVLKMAQFDHAESSDAALKSSCLKEVVTILQDIAAGHRISTNGRLKQLANDEIGDVYTGHDYKSYKSLPKSFETQQKSSTKSGSLVNHMKESASQDKNLNLLEQLEARDVVTPKASENGQREKNGNFRDNKHRMSSLLSSKESGSAEDLDEVFMESWDKSDHSKKYSLSNVQSGDTEYGRESDHSKKYSFSNVQSGDTEYGREGNSQQQKSEINAKNTFSNDSLDDLMSSDNDQKTSYEEEEIVPFRTISPAEYLSDNEICLR
eukprot:CAMPEP_0113299788 /NCGR_PEP_ID=MMETSP0010_2-20120614/1679_1 /TAXON_ID=216773 ORGANISM="Corethron hystrix, Strain 308" /NCGR_SAMPLE_ID=MMETSP0010_2 /ASSEMBLY_ACC=CAM_ASM_000155 /LENGTH=482 /DNA_ID=CAMNT_0000153085 /DNA_START=237 /DNA_END=1685 /DNA_ORIENTATION=+ /assembly_acc=CAM_ASM_000155